MLFANSLSLAYKVIVLTLSERRLRYRLIFSLCFLGGGILSNIFLPLIFKYCVEALSQGIVGSVGFILVGYGVIWTLSQASLHLRELLMQGIIERSSRILGTEVFEHLFRLSMQYHNDQETGAITSTVRRTQRNVPIILWGSLFYVVPMFIEIMVVMALLINAYPLFYSAILAITLGVFALYTLGSINWAMRARHAANAADMKAESTVMDWLLNYEIVKSFGRERRATLACRQVLEEREQNDVTSLARLEIVRLGQMIILGTGLTFLTFFLGKAVTKHTLGLGDFILFNGYVLQFVGPISILGFVFRDLKKALVDMKGIVTILHTQPLISNVSAPLRLKKNLLMIEFKNVWFRYKDRDILKNVSFNLLPNETTILVGETGAGKSTIARLLLRLYDVDSGEILINGVDIRNIDLDSLRSLMGFVSQETRLFNDTIKANITFANPNASEKNIIEVAASANLTKFIERLPLGFETHVGEGGLKLSCGERQRIAIARLLIHKPSLYIFDEPTSSLDATTAASIIKTIEHISHNATTLMITHDLSSLPKNRKILALENGEIMQTSKQVA